MKKFVYGVVTTLVVELVVLMLVLGIGFSNGTNQLNGGVETTLTFGTNGFVVENYNDVTGVTLADGFVEIGY